MKIKKKTLVTIWNRLESLKGTKENRKFSYGIVRNKKLLRDEVESIQEAQAPSEGFIKYEQDRVALCEKLGDKDDQGQSITVRGQYIFTENKKELNEEMGKLIKTSSSFIEEQKAREEEFKSVLEEEVEIDFYTMPLEAFPEEIDPAVLEDLDCLVLEVE